MRKNKEKFRFIDVPKAIWYFLVNERAKFVFFTILLLFALSYEFFPPYLIGKVLDFLTAYKKGETFYPVIIYASILALSSAIIAIIRLTSKKILAKISINARYKAKVWGFERLISFSLDWHHRESTGNKAQRIITGSESLREWTNDLANIVFPAAISFFGSLIACIFLNPLFIIFFVFYIFLLLFTEIMFDKKISKISDKLNISMENASGTFVESTANILAVKAMGADKGMASNIKEREKISKNFFNIRLNLGTTKWILFQLHNSISWGLFILFVALLVIKGNLSVGLVLTYTIYFSSLRTHSTQFTNQFQTMIERKSAMGRMMPFFWNDYSLSKGDKIFPQDWLNITLTNAFFRYKKKSAICDVNLNIHRGEKIGIAGHSGSGKSTLIKLFLGLYHLEKGAFKIGNDNIQDIRLEEITSNITVVLQETELFNLSLKENISLMRNVDPVTFKISCDIACLDEIIKNLPNGINTIIGERGYAISGGERQRIGIARAVCKNAPILLLDEATSALDSSTEKTIMERLLGDYSKDKTILIVAHRISTLKNTDRIIVFEKGSIEEEGDFELLKNDPGSLFGKMYTMQSN